MDDKFLYEMRSDPPRDFAARLRERLSADVHAAPDDQPASFPIRRLAYGAAGVAVVALLFALPPVRASAQAFLDLFRVVNFSAVPVGRDRMKALDGGKIDLPALIGEQTQIITAPGQKQTFQSAAAASAAAGFHVMMPGTLRQGLTLSTIELEGEHAARVTGDTRKLRAILDTLDIRDVVIPDGLDGQTATIRVPPMVIAKFKYGPGVVDVIQGPSPEVTAPAGIDLAALGEIGLRILGLDAGEARRIAQGIDWRSTIIVPVPATATSFRQVDVRGNRGLLVEMTAPPASDGRSRTFASLMWSEGGKVYAIKGPGRSELVMEIAEALQ